jgi:hypothetical protein
MSVTRKAMIENGKVVNIIEIDPANIPDWAAGYPDAPDVRMGDDWDGFTFSRFKPDPLIEWRETRSIPKLNFCIGLTKTLPGMTAPLFTSVEALTALAGAWPAIVLSFLTNLSPEQVVLIQGEWIVADNIHRSNEFVALLAYFLNLAPYQVDALFGWVAPT